MPTEILMPALSPTMEEGNLAKWVKEVGDEIAPGDVIAEIETDKATMEVEAIDEGRLGKILVEAGTEGVKVNTPIGLLLEEGEDDSDLEKGSSGKSGGEAKSQDDEDESEGDEAKSEKASKDSGKDGDGGSVTPLEDRKVPAEGKKHPQTEDTGGHFQQEIPEGTEMVPTTVREAIRDAMAEELRRDDAVFVMGEEVAEYEGAYKMTQGLLDEFGARRIVDTPITEHGFAGLGVGAAFGGLRPIVEFMTFNFAMQAMDQIINSAAKTLYMAGGKMGCPIVFRGPNGAAARVAAQHSQDFSSWYSHIPGLKVVTPYTAADAKGLLKSAVRDPNPVMFLENEILYGQTFDLPKIDDWTVPIGKARLHREGSDVTLVSFGIGMTYAVKAAEELAEQGIDAEIIDLRTLRPLDMDAVIASVKKTNRCVTIEEGWPQNSVGGHIASELMVHVFDYLDAPVLKITGRDVPMPYAANLEKLALPSVAEVIEAVKAVCYRD